MPLDAYLPRYDLVVLKDGDLDVVAEVVKMVAGQKTVEELWEQISS
jgi:hypothetical protein